MAQRRWSTALSFRLGAPRSSWKALVAVLAVATLPLMATALAYYMAGIPTVVMVGDALAVLDAPVYVGWVSAVGVLTGAVAATVALFSFAVLRLEGRRDVALLGALGGLTALFVLDDQFQLHEGVLPRYLGVPEPWPYLIYLAIVIPLVWRFRSDALSHPDRPILLVALAFFAVMLLLDVTALRIGGRQFLEEAAKLYGIAAWTLFVVRASTRALRSSLHGLAARGPAREPEA